jgi:hypothetical protein
MEQAIKFRNRMKSIGIEVELSCNYPWIYIDTINGKRVTEKNFSDWGLTLCFANSNKLCDNKELFSIIRKYT